MPLSIFQIHCINNDGLFGYKQTPYNIIANFYLFHVFRIINDDICATEHKLCGFIYNKVKLESFYAIQRILIHVIMCVTDI